MFEPALTLEEFKTARRSVLEYLLVSEIDFSSRDIVRDVILKNRSQNVLGLTDNISEGYNQLIQKLASNIN